MSLSAIIPAIADDGSYYKIGKLAAHEEGALHLAISVFIFDGDALLIQKRADCKYHCAGQWANTCCSHPHWEESAADAATRRLREELGIVDVPLIERGTTEYRADVGAGLWEHERVILFRAEVPRTDLQLALNPDEVSEVRWIGLDDLRAEIEETPDRFAPWLRIYLARWGQLNLK